MSAVELELSDNMMLILNTIIVLIIFGVSLEMRVDDFPRNLRTPKAPAIGMLVIAAFWGLLPALYWSRRPLPEARLPGAAV